MTKLKKNEQVMLAVVGVLAVVFVGSRFFGGRPSAPAPAASPSVETGAVTPSAGGVPWSPLGGLPAAPGRVALIPAEQLAAQLGEWLLEGNPFAKIDTRRAVVFAGADVPLRLDGVAWQPDGGSMAIINSEVVEEGQTIQGYTVSAILSDRVVLNGSDGEIILRVEK